MKKLLTQEQIAKEVENFRNFQKHWTPEKIKNMTLDEYIKLGSRETFTYTMEKNKDLNFIPMGGGNAFKFGIYEYQQIPTTSKVSVANKKYLTIHDNKYAWISYYGKTAEDAFQKIKNIILLIVQYSQSGHIDKIDQIQDLIHNLKWKIAFYFQNPQNLCQFGVVASHALEVISQKELGRSSLKASDIYYQILQKYGKPKTLEDLFQLSRKMWIVCENNDRIYSIPKEKEQKEHGTIKQQSLNKILYGSPGTGKTYNTIDRALCILGYGDITNQECKLNYTNIRSKLKKINTNGKRKLLETDPNNSGDRDCAKTLFDYYHNEGQIEFVTFHQNYGYEEFVEGIKPIPNDNGSVSYKITQGIFKRLCEVAEQNYKEANPDKYKDELKLENLVDAYLDSIREKLEQENSDGEKIGDEIRILKINSNNGLVMKKRM